MSHVVSAELVANVGSVLVAEGDRVGPTDTLVILESMKLEIPVLAEVAGTVREVAVVAGDGVQEGDILAVIDEG
jgi:biotin carboxyl carrier protein